MGSSTSTEIRNQQIPNTKTQGFTSIFRKKGLKQLRFTPENGIETIKDVLKNTVNKHGSKKGIGQVTVSMQQDAEGRDVEIRSIKEYTFQEINDLSVNLGKSLVNRRLYFQEDLHRMKMIGIYSKNRYEWFVTDWACINFGLVSVPLYDTLGKDNLSYCLNQTQIITIFANQATIPVLLELKDHGKLANVISYDRLKAQTQQQLKDHKLNLFYYEDLIKEGASLKPINVEAKTKPDDCYTFSYTSGTTGPPKGAMLSHKNVLSFVASLKYESDLLFSNTDTYLSYLPLPHIIERTAVISMVYSGAYLVVSSGNTLKLKEDCQIVKPTIFMSVPRIYSRIVEGVKQKFSAESGIKRCIIDSAIDSKLKSAHSDGEYTSGFYDSVVFDKVRESLGGNVRIMASGGAPLTPQVHAYMKAIMCCPLIEGYGQTESACGILFSRAKDTHYGTYAEIAEGIQLKLSDIKEMNYTSEDRDELNRPSPRGQVWARGPQVFLGYYKLDEATKDAITSDGWLKTGDVAQIQPDGLSFKLIDRKKNIFKLQQGQYVAPDKVETIYMQCRLVSEIFVHGQSSQHFAVAVISPNKEELLKLAKSKNINGDYEAICKNKELRTLLLIELNNFGKKNGLMGFEQAKNAYLQPEGFAAKNILTNTLKLMRFQARKVYRPAIDSLYKEGELPLK